MFGRPVGFYVDCDTAVHAECYDLETWNGFEDWTEPLAISDTSESDTPTHCAVCGDLIDHALTGDGYAYVLDALRAGTGNPEVLTQWTQRYCGDLYRASYADILAEVRADDIRHDPWGAVMSALFGIADRLHFDHGITVEGFRPSFFGPDTDNLYFDLAYLATTRDLEKAYRVLARYADFVTRADKAY